MYYIQYYPQYILSIRIQYMNFFIVNPTQSIIAIVIYIVQFWCKWVTKYLSLNKYLNLSLIILVYYNINQNIRAEHIDQVQA